MSRMCHTEWVVERGVHCRVRPRVGLGVGMGRGRVRVVEPLADQSVRVAVLPAQLRISVARRVGEGLSWALR